MKRTKFIQLFTLILLASALFSGGLVTYSHFCSTEQIAFESIKEIDHCSKNQLNEVAQKSCSKHNVTVEQKCHNTKKNTKPCCEDKIEKKSNNQIAHSIVVPQFFSFLTPSFFLSKLVFSTIEHTTRIEINKPPPLLDTQLCTKYQQFLL